MAWAIRFMVNSFVRPGDIRQLKHKHVQVVRSESTYLRLTLPETKKHDTPVVTLRPAVQVYEVALARAQAKGLGGPDDYVFLPGETDRVYALAVLGFWFKWVMREAGVATVDVLGRDRTLYCLRHTSIMFRLLYGQGIDMLTLARNARTSVQMIERFYASALDGEMNVAMLQSRRSQKG
jgi:integrase